MRSALLALLAAHLLSVSAQDFNGEPNCASACLTTAISVAGCALKDESCQCGSGFSAIQSAVAPCLLSACNQSDLAIAASVGLGLCSIYSASLATASATTTGSTKPSGTGAGTRSSIPLSTSTVTPHTTSVPATTGRASTSSLSSGKSSTSSSSSSAEASKNAAAARLAGGVMAGIGVGAAVVAVL